MRRKPVIGNALCKPVRSVIRDGEDGYLCTTPGEFAERIVRLLCDHDLARQLGEAGYQKVTASYTWDAIGRKVHDLYSEISSGSYLRLTDLALSGRKGAG